MSQPLVSRRAIACQESPIRKLAPLANQAKKDGIKVYHLNIGQPDILTPPEIMEGLRSLNVPVLEYGPSNGLPEYRAALAKYYASYDIPVSADDVLVTVGGSEAIVFAFLSCCDAGDEIIVFEPFYTNYNGFATMCDVELVPIPLKAEDGFAPPSPAVIEQKINPKTRAILLCSPNNPTGYVLSRLELEGIAEVARRHGLFIISDEVYREFTYDGLRHTSILHIPGMDPHAVIVDSISKRYSACGARIGCFVSRNQDLVRHAVKFAQARLCPATAEQLAATRALLIGPRYFDEIRAKYQRRRDVMMDVLHSIPGVIAKTPSGAFYAIVKLPIEDAEDFTRWLLTDFRKHKETVMIAPGEGFYATPGIGRDEVRLAYVIDEDDLKRAMWLFREALIDYRSVKAGRPLGPGAASGP